MSYNTPKVINVFYKEDRKPYDINGKSVSYFGEDFIGSNDSTKIRFYLQPNLPLIDFTGIVHAKRADGEVRFELLEKSSNELGNYFELSLNSWFTMKTGKVTLSLKLYTGDVTFGYTEEIITSIESIEDAIVYASDIFTFNVGYAPNATEVVPPFIDGEFEQLLFALSGKPDIGETIYVVSELPTLTGGAYDDQWFLVKGINSFGKLYHIVDSVAEEVELGAGTFRVTPSGNGDVDQGTIAGQLKWNEDTGTINMGLFDEVEVGVGESLFWYVKANEPISRGDVVQFAGNVGGEIVVKKAVFAEITNQPDLLMGVCLREIDTGRKGYILSVGRLNNVNTDAFSTPILYLSTTTNGALSSTKPTSGFKGSVSAVGRFSTGGGNNGFLLVRPNLIKGLKEATDVTITDIVNGEILRWNGSNWVNSDSLSVAEDDIDALETRADLIEGRLDVVEPIVAQHTVDISDLDNRIDFIEDNGGIDFIKVATFSALPTSGEVRNHRLFLTEDTKQLWEFDGTQYNETSPKNLSNIVVSSEDDTTALRVVADTTQDEDVVSVEIDEEKQVWIEKDGKFNALNEANFYDNVTIAGNLTINGTTTTVNTTTLDVEDNIITINKNQTGTPETNLLSGIEVERGDETNFQFVFQESSDLFKVGQVGDLQAVATRQDTPTDLGVAYFNTTTNRFENTTNLKVNASGQLVDTTIRNTGTTVIPLIVNTISGTTSAIQEWQSNGTQRAYIDNDAGRLRTTAGVANRTNFNSSLIQPTDTGTIISRNIADANSALRVDLVNSSSTGNIANFQFAGANKLEITKDGFLTQNGTRLFSQPVDTSNTFFGNLTGNLTLTGGSNTVFGSNSFTSATSGNANVIVGRGAGNSITSGFGNILVGLGSGASLTSATNSTFIGRSAGDNASQLATATNSTAIGYEAYTDASNQMVFGNASVTEFKFDRNESALAKLPRTEIVSSTFPPLQIDRRVAFNLPYGAIRLLATNQVNMTNAFGVLQTFSIRDDANVINDIARIGAFRSGADNSGRLTFNTTNAGTDAEKMTILPSGNVGIGTTAPSEKLEVQGNLILNGANSFNYLYGYFNQVGFPNYSYSLLQTGASDATTGTRGLVINENHGQTVSNYGITLATNNVSRLFINTSGNVGIGTSAPAYRLSINEGDAYIYKATTTPSLIINRNDGLTLSLATGSTSSIFGYDQAGVFAIQSRTKAEILAGTFDASSNRLIVNGSGLVGINETAPTAQLQVKSGAVGRIPLIVNTIADHTALLQEWQINGTAQARITNSGYLSGLGLLNLSSSNNASIVMLNAGTTISRNIADSNPALIINQANASSTGKIASFRFNGVEKSFIDKDGNFSGASVIPTYDLLGSRAGTAGDGTITVTDISLYDELVVELLFDTGIDGKSNRTQAPVITHFQPGGAGDLNGLTVVSVQPGGTTLVSATVEKGANNTTLNVDFGGTVTDYVVNVYGVLY
jgi:hypothetical protein